MSPPIVAPAPSSASTTLAPVLASPWRIAVALLAVYVVWGSTYLGIRVAIESIPPLLMAGGRFVIAGGLMIAFARLGLKTPWPTRRQWRDAAIVGACLLLGGNGGVTLAELVLPSGLAALLVTTVPMFLLLFGWWAGISPRPGFVTVLALAFGWLGVALLVRPATVPVAASALVPSQAQFYGSVALILVAAAIWAAGSLYAKRADKPSSAVLAVGAQMLSGGAFQLLAGTLHGEWSQLRPDTITAHSVWAFVYLTLVGSIIGYSAYVWLLGVCPPMLVGTYAFINPAVAVLLGWAIVGEPVTRNMLLGMTTTLAAVALIVLFPPKATAKSPTLR